MLQVGFSHSTGFWSWLSRIIMWASGRSYSHCWILCSGDHAYRSVPLVLTEDEDGGLHFMPWAWYGGGKVIVTVLDLPFDIEPGLDALLLKLGEPYDYSGLLGEGWVTIMSRWFHRKVKNPFANASRMWCSESVYFALSQVPQYNIAPGTSDDVDPGTVYDTIIQAGGKPAAGYKPAP